MKQGSAFLERYFELRKNGTTVRTEIVAGLTTFFTMAYIVFVQSAVLSGGMFQMTTGMDFGAVLTATCLATALASAIMGLYARYPIAQSAGMGENFFFVLTALSVISAAGLPNPWQVALGSVFWSGILFVLLTFIGVRERLLNAISPSLKMGISAGIGLFIAFIGLKNAGIIIASPGTLVQLTPKLLSPDVMVFVVGLMVSAGLMARKFPGAILVGIGAATALAAGLRLSDGIPWIGQWLQGSQLQTSFKIAGGVMSLPPSLGPTFFKLDLIGALNPSVIHLIGVFLFMLVFDTMGTLVGVAQQAGLLQNNELPRAKEAMVSDAAATVVGATLGTSTVTSFIESAAGVEAGGRTGLTALVTAGCFLLALFFSPLVGMVGSYASITAPALILVGSMMLRNVRNIQWEDPTEVLPAFIVMLGIPLSFAISDGLALGLLSYPLIKLCAGRGREVPIFIYALGVVLILYFLFLA